MSSFLDDGRISIIIGATIVRMQKTEQGAHLNGPWRTVKRSKPHTFGKGK